MAHFEFRPGDGSPAEYGGVDWRAIRIRKVGEATLKAAEVWLIVNEDDTEYSQLLNQDNLHIELNTVAPQIDRMSVADERDGEWWVWYRDEMEEDEFETTIDRIGWAGKVVQTMYPQPDVVDLYEARRLRELEADFE